MKENTGENRIRKPFYKNCWFWVVAIIVIGVIAVPETKNETPASSQVQETAVTNTQNTSSEEFVKDVESVIQNAIAAEGESITDVVLNNRDLHVTVDLSNADLTFLTVKDLAISRASSITDEILDLSDYDDLWDTITVDFGDIGKIVCSKDDVTENEYGMRCFPSENLILR